MSNYKKCENNGDFSGDFSGDFGDCFGDETLELFEERLGLRRPKSADGLIRRIRAAIAEESERRLARDCGPIGVRGARRRFAFVGIAGFFAGLAVGILCAAFFYRAEPESIVTTGVRETAAMNETPKTPDVHPLEESPEEIAACFARRVFLAKTSVMADISPVITRRIKSLGPPNRAADFDLP